MKKQLFYLILGSLMLSSYGLYKSYENQATVPTDVYGEVKTDSIGNMAATRWRELFSDLQPQTLIEQVLEQNSDVQTARLRNQQAELSYKTSKLAYLPTIAFSPSIDVTKKGDYDKTWSTTLGMAASWQLDIFGVMRG